MRPSLTIVHLYPTEMNTYGDRGNLLALVARLRWRGFAGDVVPVGAGDAYDLRRADLIVAGGGPDRAQRRVSEDLQLRRQNVHEAAEAGVVMLAVCGSYQLLGHRFLTAEGRVLPGVGIFDTETVGSPGRMTGDIVIDTRFGRLVGFENHSGRTRLAPDQVPLGSVLMGSGNDATSGTEGAVTGNVFGTYLHGPVLAKNPAFADGLLLLALRRRHGIDSLAPLDDTLEHEAVREVERRRFHASAWQRLQTRLGTRAS